MLPLASLKKTYAYHVVRRYILGLLYRVPLTKKYAYRRLPRHRSGYKHYYVHDKKYVATLQAKTERVKSIERYPSTEALRSRIDKNGGRKVLDAGCGYGRLLERIALYYDAEGCDVSEELLNQTRSKGLKAFQLDLVDPPEGWPEQNAGIWDVAYCRAVFMFFIDHREDTFRAMQTLDTVTKNRVLIWDWPHVCDYMRETYPSDKFEYHEIPFTST